MSELKECQVYICIESNGRYWTKGLEYVVTEELNGLALVDDNGAPWYNPFGYPNAVKFKLKHEIDERWLDLNTLTLEELSEYVELSKDAIRACNRIETFINYRK